VKLGLLLFLMHPETKGAYKIYTNFLRPFLVQYQDDIDSTLNMAREQANTIYQKGEEAARDISSQQSKKEN